MRDGIYRVDFRSGRPEDKGIAMLRAGLFKGLDQDHGYTGNLEAAEGRVSGYITFRDSSAQRSLEISSDTVEFKGVENLDGFEISGMSETQARREYKIRATWIAEL
jgi:hypothetical protein